VKFSDTRQQQPTIPTPHLSRALQTAVPSSYLASPRLISSPVALPGRGRRRYARPHWSWEEERESKRAHPSSHDLTDGYHSAFSRNTGIFGSDPSRLILRSWCLFVPARQGEYFWRDRFPSENRTQQASPLRGVSSFPFLLRTSRPTKAGSLGRQNPVVFHGIRSEPCVIDGRTLGSPFRLLSLRALDHCLFPLFTRLLPLQFAC